jgi:CheY-like chemotaxis protein
MDIEAIPFSPLRLIHDIFTVMNHQATEKGLSLELYSNIASDAVVLGDPGRLRQILTNLIGNSIKFTDEGSISLTIENSLPNITTPMDDNMMDLTPPVRRTSDDRKASLTEDQMLNIRFTVKDTGIGIDAEAMRNLFKPFSQADSSTARTYGGSGLGLTICRQLVGLMEGTIGLESTVGGGTVATFNIPFYVYDQKQILGKRASPFEGNESSFMDWKSQDLGTGRRTSKDGANVTAPQQLYLSTDSQGGLTPEERAKLHILVVEDNAVNRKVVCLSIVKLGFGVFAVNNGQEALDYLSKSSTQPRPDVILMDCQMPIVDGYQATNRIRHDTENFDEETRKIPIIALTASAVKGDHAKTTKVGMDDYLKKPVTKDTLERSLLKWLLAAKKPS